jgi:hypothetical protein
MTILERPSRRDRAQKPPRRRLLRVVAVAVGLVLVFVVGMAFGQALDDGPAPGGGLTTIVRTLTPIPQESPPRTVTVTVTEP